jgi:hypothetical protein
LGRWFWAGAELLQSAVRRRVAAGWESGTVTAFWPAQPADPNREDDADSSFLDGNRAQSQADVVQSQAALLVPGEGESEDESEGESQSEEDGAGEEADATEPEVYCCDYAPRCQVHESWDEVLAHEKVCKFEPLALALWKVEFGAKSERLNAMQMEGVLVTAKSRTLLRQTRPPEFRRFSAEIPFAE